MVNEQVKNEIVEALSSDQVKDHEDALKTYAKDWTYQPDALAGLVVFPRSTEEVSKVMKIATAHKISVVPSGGRTGLAGGCVAAPSQIVVSFDKMNRIQQIDPIDMSARVEAGVTTQALQDEAKLHGLFFSLDLAAKGSCQIGGNLATNAGGLKLIKYGGAREQVLGLTAVLSDGTIVDLNTALRKNNTGLDCRQLFIGTEGTFGLITEATLKLSPPPNELELACLCTDSFQKIPELLTTCFKQSVVPTAYEFFTDQCLRVVLKNHANCKDPFEGPSKYYLLLEVEKPNGMKDSILEGLLEKAFEQELVSDGVIAGSSSQFQELWALRENISESMTTFKHLYKNDVSVSIGQLTEVVSKIEKVSNASKLDLYLFGHIGDGNLHINYASDSFDSHDAFILAKNGIEQQIFEILTEHRGSISAEHGIGTLKKDHLSITCTTEEIALMKKIKDAIDPENILNPGKVLPG